MMDFSGRQYIPYNRELFAFLPGEQMSIPHGHGDILVTHELLQLHERDLAGLRQPGGEGMPHGVQGDGVQAVAVFWCKAELSDGGLKAGGRFLERHLFAGLLEDGFRRLPPVRLKHLNHIFGHTDEDTFSPFLNDIEAAGVGIHVLPAQLENLRGPEAGSQREQSHVVQLQMTLFKIVQKGFGFLSGQEAQSFIVGFDHLPCAALSGQRIDAAPYAGGDGTVYGGAHEREDIVHGLPSQCFPLPCFRFGISCGLFALCIPGRRFQELRLEIGKQIRGQFNDREGMNFGLEMGAVLAVMLVNILSFASAPGKVGIDDLPDGDFIPFNGIDAGGLKLGKEFCPLFSGCGRAYAFTMSADGFPVTLAFVVSVPEDIDEIGLACARITLGRLAAENALELGFYVFSASCALHESSIASEIYFCKMLIHNLSKMDFRDKNLEYNYLNLLIIYLLLLAICDRERERESTLRSDATNVALFCRGSITAYPVPKIRTAIPVRGRRRFEKTLHGCATAFSSSSPAREQTRLVAAGRFFLRVLFKGFGSPCFLRETAGEGTTPVAGTPFFCDFDSSALCYAATQKNLIGSLCFLSEKRGGFRSHKRTVMKAATCNSILSYLRNFFTKKDTLLPEHVFFTNFSG